ncbi:MAG: hypothetical protein ABII81_09785 [Pseudomonadota bacterium]
MPNNIPRLRRAIFLSLYLVVIVSFGEVQSLIAGTIANHVQLSTPLALKLAKDAVIWLAVLYFFICKRDRLNHTAIQIAWWGFVLLVGLSMTVSILNGESMMLSVAGLRWCAPIFLFIGAIGVVTKADIAFMALIMRRLFLVHFALQLIELFFAAPYFGLTPWGLNLRNPGIFVIPNTGGLFTVLAAFFCLNFSADKCGWRNKLMFIASALLTASGTAIVSLIVIYFIHYAYKFRGFWLLFAPLGLALALWVMSLAFSDIRGDNYLQASLGTRLEIIGSQMSDAGFISEAFGAATNTAFMLGVDSARAADSTYASVLGNLGWAGFAVFILGMVYAFYISEKNKSRDLFMLLSFSMLAAFTSILNEAYPFNFIMPILFAYYFSLRFTPSK